ncbi:mitochondrial carrier [Hyaloscypha bicolor E]|uniref:Mitochondrial carrier n=1 Tax=Hyaloscypha bicolor E TaxID=1095630 RepID=A0A2J6SU03_9HELO|nr:mitochondrial carrier [Hyaloscypha bicolor E]PMD54255.1 mitochondrial carrier [Hyaloscypha bicolor E]
MFSTLLERMGSPSRPTSRDGATRASPSESLLSAITVDDSPLGQSSSSTPPTSIGDSVSISSTSLKLENIEPNERASAEPSTERSRRARSSIGTYNVKVLSGTAIHAPKKYSKDPSAIESRRRTISGDTLVSALASNNSSTETVEKDANRLVRDGIEALDLQWSVKGLPKSRSQIAGLSKAKRELRNLADTPEYAKIDTKPVVHEVWSNGKLVIAEPPRKKKKVEEVAVEKKKLTPETDKRPDPPKFKDGKREKVWLNKGLYAGQEHRNFDWFADQSGKTRKDIVDATPYQPNKFMPLPMWHGQRLLHIGRHFKLPFDVCSPLPPGQPKPDEWRKTSSNRFVGDAAAMWKKSSLFDSFSSKCVCTPEGGCDEDCQNRIMLYECDDTNCAAGRDKCTNRAFADLQERRKGGGKYRIGVEVIKTEDRGYGVRTNRCFDAHQIIVEYTGEIITEDECDRRMNEDYKNNECYYLMSFDQNMIIDATKGSIARFVNHSCKPNCRMVKWIVGGKPRMALFAGDGPIMTGEELTYDYNFDPFSAKNVQECRCGSDNCRGVLGPKPKPPVKESIKEAVKAGVKAGKRKLKELLGGDEDDRENSRSPKKRKIKQAKGLKRSASSASMKMAKGAAKAVKRTISAQLLNARRAVGPKRVIKKTMKGSSLKVYGNRKTQISSRNSSLTIVATDGSPKRGKAKSLIGGMTAATLTAPLDVLKTRLQSDFYQAQLAQTRLMKGISPHAHLSPLRSGLLHFRETFQILGSVHRVEGWRALFKGLGPNLLGVVPARSINFFVVGNGKRIIADYGNKGEESAWVVLCAAALAGIVTSTVTNPIWLIKTRLQLDKNIVEKTGGVAVRKYRNSWDCIKQVVGQEGIRGLYKGMSASYLGVTESTLQWVLYEQMKKSLAKREERILLSGRPKNIWDRTLEWTGNVGAAGGAKLVAALATYPHEVARTRLRQAPTENGHLKYTGLVQCFKLIWKEEGMVAMYGGLTPHLLRTVPSAAIMFGMYEGILKLLHAPS